MKQKTTDATDDAEEKKGHDYDKQRKNIETKLPPLRNQHKIDVVGDRCSCHCRANFVPCFYSCFDYHRGSNYYDEDNIAIGSPLQCQVVVNRTIELTEDEKAQARKTAIDRVHNEHYDRLKQPVKKSHPKQAADNNQLNLF
ncbi:hypothetical protein AGMMS4957_22520 [Bacteroidia bacterium]|nr:hypothetical protein AGMMS4957_22520 [Bacteroidia bacterium]